MTSPNHLLIDGERYYVYREHFPEGDFTGYTNGNGKYRFWVDELRVAVTGPELADYLTAEYHQVSESGIRAAMTNYADLRGLPS